MRLTNKITGIISLEKIPFIFFGVYILFSLLFVKNFSKPINLLNILVQSSDLIILACGMTFVFMNGGIDFSIVATVGLGSIMGASLMTVGGNPHLLSIAGVFLILLIGLAIGVVNGLIITRLKMPSFIATMATQLIFAGFALWFTESGTIGGLPKPFLFLGKGKVIGVPMPIIIMIVVVAVSAFILHKTVLGRYIYAIGTNHKASEISGVPVKNTIMKLFIFSGLLGAVASIVMTSRSGTGMPAMGKFMLMDIVGAVVLGGTAVTGGKGNMIGTAAGAILIIVLNNSLNLLDVEWFVINALKGAMIIAVALLGIFSERTENTKRTSEKGC